MASNWRSPTKRPAGDDCSGILASKYSNRSPPVTVRRLCVHESWAKRPASAIILASANASGELRTSTVSGTPVRYSCWRSASDSE